MCGGVAAATGISGAGEGPVGIVPLPSGSKGGTAGTWPPQGGASARPSWYVATTTQINTGSAYPDGAPSATLLKGRSWPPLRMLFLFFLHLGRTAFSQRRWRFS